MFLEASVHLADGTQFAPKELSTVEYSEKAAKRMGRLKKFMLL